MFAWRDKIKTSEEFTAKKFPLRSRACRQGTRSESREKVSATFTLGAFFSSVLSSSPSARYLFSDSAESLSLCEGGKRKSFGGGKSRGIEERKMLSKGAMCKWRLVFEENLRTFKRLGT
jgi:hypothetical protein